MGLIRIHPMIRRKRKTKEYIRTVYSVQWARDNNWGGELDWQDYANLPWYDNYERAWDVVQKKKDKNPNLYFDDDVLFCDRCKGRGVHVPGCEDILTKLRR